MYYLYTYVYVISIHLPKTFYFYISLIKFVSSTSYTKASTEQKGVMLCNLLFVIPGPHESYGFGDQGPWGLAIAWHYGTPPTLILDPMQRMCMKQACYIHAQREHEITCMLVHVTYIELGRFTCMMVRVTLMDLGHFDALWVSCTAHMQSIIMAENEFTWFYNSIHLVCMYITVPNMHFAQIGSYIMLHACSIHVVQTFKLHACITCMQTCLHIICLYSSKHTCRHQ